MASAVDNRIASNISKVKNTTELVERMIGRLNDSVKAVPNAKVYQGNNVNMNEILEFGTRKNTGDIQQVFISTEEMRYVSEYLKKCTQNKKTMEKIIISVQPYSNDSHKFPNNVCEIKDADFVDLLIITPDRTINTHINKMNPITREVGTYIDITNTSWKNIRNIGNGRNKKEVLLDRIIFTAADYVERTEHKEFVTREEFMSYFNRIEAIDTKPLIGKIKNCGVSINGQPMRRYEFTRDDLTLPILKFMYNKYKNDSLRACGTGAYNDSTLISFETDGKTLSFQISYNKKFVDFY